ncbi:MAG: hypothetical protein ACTHMC_08205 [Pseudobacter sp.]|uniref:hypothetical protein n=1 Tax=Pseudobacter sp. TaxID=2045420 RepID=UPI003F7D94FE
MPIKILILEDVPREFVAMANSIEKKFGNKVEVHPEIEPGDQKIQAYHYFVEKKLQMVKFDEIITKYNDIDLFIIDICLMNGEQDDLGLRFYNFLSEKKYRDGDYHSIIVSSKPTQVTDEKTFFISKIRSPLYYHRVTDIISDLYPQLRQEENKTSNDKVKHTLFENGLLDGCNKIIMNINDAIKWVIHAIILGLFYLLIAFAIGFGAWSITLDFIKLVKEKSEGMDIFKPAEHIFLYLLPVFIIFGFFNYYRSNTSIYLLGGNKKDIDEEKSTESMNLTKKIFISTIISYILVKCTEEIFFGDCSNMFRLSGAGILLLMLMAYYIVLYRKHH